MDSLALVRALSEANGVSGFEDEVVGLARSHAPHGARLEEDSLRNLYIYQAGGKTGRPVVMLDAHSDEVGFMVQAVRPDGLLQIVPVGGWVPSSLPAHRVRVRTAGGAYVPGVVATKPPHYLSEAEKGRAPQMADLFVDLGACSAREVEEEFGVGPGAPVVPDVTFSHNPANGVMLGKAFDCRVGCACVLELMNRLWSEAEALDVEPVGTITSQEEVGGRGAIVAVRRVKPKVAIVFEGTPADDTFGNGPAAQTVLHKGPMLRHIDRSMIANPRFMRLALDVAKKQGIPLQEGVRSGGGTNGGYIHIANLGIPTIVIGVPVRYIHTHHGYAALDDYRNSINLGLALVRGLTAEIIAGF